MLRTHHLRAPRLALTLVELMVTLAVLVGLAALVVPLLSSSVDEAKDSTTRANIKQIRDVILGQYRLDMSRKLPRPGETGIDSSRQKKPQIRFLYFMPSDATLFNPDTKLGWRGPYLMLPTGTYAISGSFTTEFGEANDPAVLDGWGRPIVIRESADKLTAEVRSAGSDGVLSAMGATDGDDIYLTLFKP